MERIKLVKRRMPTDRLADFRPLRIYDVETDLDVHSALMFPDGDNVAVSLTTRAGTINVLFSERMARQFADGLHELVRPAADMDTMILYCSEHSHELNARTAAFIANVRDRDRGRLTKKQIAWIRNAYAYLQQRHRTNPDDEEAEDDLPLPPRRPVARRRP
jgi:hypothetical protein